MCARSRDRKNRSASPAVRSSLRDFRRRFEGQERRWAGARYGITGADGKTVPLSAPDDLQREKSFAAACAQLPNSYRGEKLTPQTLVEWGKKFEDAVACLGADECLIRLRILRRNSRRYPSAAQMRSQPPTPDAFRKLRWSRKERNANPWWRAIAILKAACRPGRSPTAAELLKAAESDGILDGVGGVREQLRESICPQLVDPFVQQQLDREADAAAAQKQRDIETQQYQESKRRLAEKWAPILGLIEQTFGEAVTEESIDAKFTAIERLIEKEHPGWTVDDVHRRICDLNWLAAFLRENADALLAEGTGAAAPGEQSESFPNVKPTPDFATVIWHNETLTFTPLQAAIVKQIWPTLGTGAERSFNSLLAEVEDDSRSVRGRIDHIFRGSNAWQRMIVPGKKKGNVRLADPHKPLPTPRQKKAGRGAKKYT